MRTAVLVIWSMLGACGRSGFDENAGGDGGSASGDGGGSGDALVVRDGTVPVTGLVSWWSLSDGSGQVAHAMIGTDGVLGTSTTAEAIDPQWDTTPGHSCAGTGLRFDGVDDIVTVPGPSTANLSAFTITFSMYATGAGGGQLPRILSKEDGGSADTVVHFRAIDNAVAINMLNTSNTLFASYGGSVVLGQRANWALTYDDAGDRTVHLYQNGTEVSYIRHDTITGMLRLTTQSWEIGDQAARTRAFAGTLDEIRVYDRVLDPSEIAALSAACPP